MKVGELFYSLGFDVDNKSLKPFDDGIKDLANSFDMLTKAAGITGGAYAIDKFIDNLTDVTGKLHNFTEQTGLSNQELQHWQFAASLSAVGLSADDVTQSISNLENQLVNIQQHTGGNPNVMARLGIDPSMMKTPFEILDKLRETIKHYDRATFTNLIQQIGINPAFVNLLEKSDAEFAKLSSHQILSPAQIEAVNQFALKIKEIQANILILVNSLGANLAPGLDKFIDKDLPKFVNGLKVLAKDMKSIGNDFQVPAEAIAASIALIAAVIAPVSAAIIALAYVIEKLGDSEWQKAARAHGADIANRGFGAVTGDLLSNLAGSAGLTGGNGDSNVNSNNTINIHGNDTNAAMEEAATLFYLRLHTHVVTTPNNFNNGDVR